MTSESHVADCSAFRGFRRSPDAKQRRARDREPGVLDLFGPRIRRTTLLTIVVCACSLSAWWAFMVQKNRGCRQTFSNRS